MGFFFFHFTLRLFVSSLRREREKKGEKRLVHEQASLQTKKGKKYECVAVSQEAPLRDTKQKHGELHDSHIILHTTKKPTTYGDAPIPLTKKGKELMTRKTTNIRKLTRNMLHHFDRLIEQGVIEESKEGKAFCSLFTIVKKSGKLRLLCNAKPVNRLWEPPS